MDFWTVLLIAAGFTGIMGWFFTIPICSGILLYCNWRDGDNVDWASEIGFMMALPLAYFFAIFEVIMLYSK